MCTYGAKCSLSRAVTAVHLPRELFRHSIPFSGRSFQWTGVIIRRGVVGLRCRSRACSGPDSCGADKAAIGTATTIFQIGINLGLPLLVVLIGTCQLVWNRIAPAGRHGYGHNEK